ICLYLYITPPLPCRPLLPYTTLFRSAALDDAAPLSVEVHRVLPEQWRAHRELRLDMLEADPDAFWADLAEVRSRTEAQWREEIRSEEHTSELQSRFDLVFLLLLEKKK